MKRSRTQRFVVPRVACAIAGALAAPTFAAVPYEVVAVSGRAAQGTAAGVVYDSFEAPVMNDRGAISFGGEVTGTGITANNDGILYSGTTTTLNVVARDGSQAPGLAAGIVYATPGQPALSDNGTCVFASSLAGTGITSANGTAMFGSRLGTTQLVGQQGVQAPNVPAGVTFSQFFAPTVNELGQMVFLSFLGGSATSANNRAIFAGFGIQPMQLVARSGAQATDLPVGVNFNGFAGPAINDTGNIAYRTSVVGTGVTADNDLTIYAGTITTQHLVARENSQVPGAPTGVLYAGLSTPALSDSGHIAFITDLRGAVTTASDSALIAGGMTAPTTIAREGDQAAGLAAGVVYDSFRALPALNDVGRITFTATVAGTGVTAANNEALYLGQFIVPQLTPVVRTGDLIPGSTTATFATFNFDAPAINNVDQLAFTANIAGAGVDPSNDFALFSYDPALGKQLVAREGDLFNIGNGQVRTIADGGIFFLPGRTDDTANGIGNDGTIAFRLTFTDDSSGIFTALIRIPGDANGDRRVNFDDLVLLAQHYNNQGTQRLGDFTNDGVVNFDDLIVLAQHYNTIAAAQTVPGNIAGDWALAQSLVPEPASAGLTLFSAMLVLRRARGRITSPSSDPVATSPRSLLRR